ncbi:iron-sulfur cluster assembly accessory protein [Sphaerotilus natans subsp. natans DSM 6575]|uniref:Iron-sulfur cluster assembly accessory protein n=1 Tax=Sphaerotilus natans subsp. natans DSM 6575 TaxID=1286631 RepID=A0A059KKK2_9BURK|nr:iron-sulfur cluster assembly accessory protein [Sphaerotilus natans]KDB51749.1 iron-sulfur cluster assembly accessory protein [Sphaerotilus natans subsp. natans DSM 6575]SIR96579.1 Iron-sulfur cluster assembly accessory protein [Sphaerotilus natans]
MILPNVTVLPAAEKFIRRMVRFSDHPTGGMRLTVTPGGCSGYSSEFTIEPAPRAGDAELSLAGTRVFLPAESRLVLDGIVVDFVDSPTRSGLTFTHPGQAPCACSSSGDASAMPAESGVTLDSIRRIVRG